MGEVNPVLHFYSNDSKKSSIVCSVKGCKHQKDCPAQMKGSSFAFKYQDHLYYTRASADVSDHEILKTDLMKASLDLKDVSKIATLEHAVLGNETFLRKGEYLYLPALRTVIKKIPIGPNAYRRLNRNFLRLERVNLETGSREKLTEDVEIMHGQFMLVGEYKDRVYCRAVYPKDEDKYIAQDDFVSKWFYYDLKSKEVVHLDEAVLASAWRPASQIVGNKLYAAAEDLIIYDLESSEYEVVAKNIAKRPFLPTSDGLVYFAGDKYVYYNYLTQEKLDISLEFQQEYYIDRTYGDFLICRTLGRENKVYLVPKDNITAEAAIDLAG